MDLGLRDKVALVTAASKGLGFAAARELVREGARVMICSRNEDHLDEAIDRLKAEFGEDAPVAANVADVSSRQQAEDLVGQTVADFDGLDILITNAGGPPKGAFVDITREQWEHGLHLTLMSAVYLIRAAVPHLHTSDAPSILTVTSVSVKQPVENLMLSNVIRPAVAGLTKVLSQELGPDGIRVNSILPGWTATERVTYLLDGLAEQKETTAEEEAAKITASVPLGRMGRPEEFGKVAAFLVSPAASYVNGVMMLVDGGSYAGLM